MNKAKGNMYPFVSHTWNPIVGTCPHKCSYCYMRKFPLGELRLNEKVLNEDLGINNSIFVGSSTDMFCEGVKEEWIQKVFSKIELAPGNNYYMQSKDTARMVEYVVSLGGIVIKERCVFGTTLETNRKELLSKYSCKSSAIDRIFPLSSLFRTYLTIEPIMDFDLRQLLVYIDALFPEFIAIGADSKNSNLPEPSKDKVLELLSSIEPRYKVIRKDNLKRIIGG